MIIVSNIIFYSFYFSLFFFSFVKNITVTGCLCPFVRDISFLFNSKSYKLALKLHVMCRFA